MFALSRSIRAWGTAGFEAVLKQEVAEMDASHLPLQQALVHSSHVAEGPRQVAVLRVHDAGTQIQVRIGIFYAGIIAGCSCADDPTPIDEQPEYCEVQLDIDKRTGQSTMTLASSE